MSEKRSDQLPPVGVESWVDFILAIAAHRSSDEGQRKFGDLLIHRYFVELPNRYQGDETASMYFDEMLCAVASAMRGMAVARAIFQTNTKAIQAASDEELEGIRRLNAFAPLTKEGHWGRVVSIIVGTGIGVPLARKISTGFEHSSLVMVVYAVIFLAFSQVLVQFVVEGLSVLELKKRRLQFPETLRAHWQGKALESYCDVLLQFLPLAYEITDRYYPSNSTGSPVRDEAELRKIIGRHMAFKPASCMTDKDKPGNPEVD